MKVEESVSSTLLITEVDGLDPVRVTTENYELGKGRITISCFNKAWTASWRGMEEQTVQEFFTKVSNNYLIGCLAPMMNSVVDDDNDANVDFVKSEICKLRRLGEISQMDARDMWGLAESSDDVKTNCCSYHYGDAFLNLLGHYPYYAGWPTAPNPEYKYLERILNAVREAFLQRGRNERKASNL